MFSNDSLIILLELNVLNEYLGITFLHLSLLDIKK